ncbi:hypothetical protein [Halalkalicoccus salilacus]|uniref:hypothetical protein n=1 Tax=Halalkalicoccus salilacus TaxID=3117459 RepID=UPI00300EA5B7
MADTKRGRERSGLGKERQRRLEEIEHDLAALREAGPTSFETPMVASYTVLPDEEPIRLECWGFEELGYGVVLHDEDGEELAYLSHESLIAIEPAPLETS